MRCETKTGHVLRDHGLLKVVSNRMVWVHSVTQSPLPGSLNPNPLAQITPPAAIARSACLRLGFSFGFTLRFRARRRLGLRPIVRLCFRNGRLFRCRFCLRLGCPNSPLPFCLGNALPRTGSHTSYVFQSPLTAPGGSRGFLAWPFAFNLVAPHDF